MTNNGWKPSAVKKTGLSCFTITFPPYSVGEVKRVGSPSRRDIGHGGLSTRALERVLPDKEDFDYTIRIVSEVLESNGSSSMGTVCSGALAMMDGGVPIKAPVSGIAMGLVKEGDQVVILSDILGDEDHTGDMDFKVTGTAEGITALQMDIKIHELSRDIMERALDQAKAGRLHILDKMLEALAVPREEISPFAPKIISIKINPDKIRDIIGPGGKVIRAIQSETNTKIEIDDSGLVKIAATSAEDGEAARLQVETLTMEPEVGAIYEGKVVKTTDFGAFVQIVPGTGRPGAHQSTGQPPCGQGDRCGQRGRYLESQGPGNFQGWQDPPQPQGRSGRRQ